LTILINYLMTGSFTGMAAPAAVQPAQHQMPVKLSTPEEMPMPEMILERQPRQM